MPHLTRNRVTAAQVFMAVQAVVHTVEEGQTQRYLRAEHHWNRTGDPILTIDTIGESSLGMMRPVRRRGDLLARAPQATALRANQGSHRNRNQRASGRYSSR